MSLRNVRVVPETKGWVLGAGRLEFYTKIIQYFAPRFFFRISLRLREKFNIHTFARL